MVKVNKVICIDTDLYKRLEKINASSLIQSLLYKYFKEKDEEEKEINNG